MAKRPPGTEAPSARLRRAWDMLAGTICAPAAWPRTVLAKLRPDGRLDIAPASPPHDAPLPPLDAAEVEALIRALACHRAAMKPDVPRRRPENPPLWFGDGMKFAVVPAADGSDEWRLFIRHPGLGWIALPLAPNELRGLQRRLQDAFGPLPAP